MEKMEWVSVGYSLPSLHEDICEDGEKFLISEDVLVCCTDIYGVRRTTVANYEKDEMGYLYSGWVEAIEGTKLYGVTHWMPLPDLPQ